jgi:diadenosine tetraphosphate (Ap4A) HIT family hydrolase
MVPSCPFCSLPDLRIRDCTCSSLLIEDAYPVSPGHALLIPRRHVPSLFDLTNAERTDLLDLLSRARAKIQADLNPDGFNIGINDGPAAGQTVMHLHIHLIPRYAGDRPDPRGGVRWVFPEKADYWSGKG